MLAADRFDFVGGAACGAVVSRRASTSRRAWRSGHVRMNCGAGRGDPGASNATEIIMSQARRAV